MPMNMTNKEMNTLIYDVCDEFENISMSEKIRIVKTSVRYIDEYQRRTGAQFSEEQRKEGVIGVCNGIFLEEYCIKHGINLTLEDSVQFLVRTTLGLE